jgi:hypothetical protein
MLKVRDIFDIAVVDSLFSDTLRAHLHLVAHLKEAVSLQLENISDEYWRLEVDELEIADEWRTLGIGSRERMRDIISKMT